MQFLLDLIRLCRPQHWVKNVFVLMPLLFSPSLGDLSASLAALIATLCFCLWSSAVYAFNDVLDAKADARHPEKRRRPLPSGRITPPAAIIMSLGLAGSAFVLGYASLPASFLVYGGLYLANSLLYCVLLKYRVIVDVLSIAIGFTIRLLAGCAAIEVIPSSWILVCGFSLAMLLGFGKRRIEVAQQEQLTTYRPTLQSYSPQKVDTLLGIASSVCLLTYMLYTIAPETIQLHKTDKLIYTVPFVAYGVFRYLFKVQEGKGSGPVEILLKDLVFALNGLLWLLAVGLILYLS